MTMAIWKFLPREFRLRSLAPAVFGTRRALQRLLTAPIPTPLLWASNSGPTLTVSLPEFASTRQARIPGLILGISGQAQELLSGARPSRMKLVRAGSRSTSADRSLSARIRPTWLPTLRRKDTTHRMKHFSLPLALTARRFTFWLLV